MMRAILIALAAPVLLGGCALWQPTLRAKAVPTVPAPNFAFTGTIWHDAPVLKVKARRGSGRGAPERDLQLRAICDGTAVSILVAWRDDSESFTRREWAWDAKAETYKPLWIEVDRLRIEWPISGATSFDLLEPEPAVYDAWTWEAGWSNISGQALDQSISVAPQQEAVAPPDSTGEVHRARDGNNFVRVTVTDDPGLVGTIETLKPRRYDKDRMPGAVAQRSTGSAADVRVWGLFNRYDRGEKKTWFVDGRDSGMQLDDAKEGFWMVQFYRLLETGDKERDVQLAGAKTIEFAVAVTDGGPWAGMLRTPPIRLIIPGQP